VKTGVTKLVKDSGGIPRKNPATKTGTQKRVPDYGQSFAINGPPSMVRQKKGRRPNLPGQPNSASQSIAARDYFFFST
jgi:hypothetical protein